MNEPLFLTSGDTEGQRDRVPSTRRPLEFGWQSQSRTRIAQIGDEQRRKAGDCRDPAVGVGDRRGTALRARFDRPIPSKHHVEVDRKTAKPTTFRYSDEHFLFVVRAAGQYPFRTGTGMEVPNPDRTLAILTLTAVAAIAAVFSDAALGRMPRIHRNGGSQ